MILYDYQCSRSGVEEMTSFKTLLALVMFTIAVQAVAQDSKPSGRVLPDELLLLEPEWVLRNHITNLVKPTYPEEAQTSGIQGEVLVFVWFDHQGKFVEGKILRSAHESLSDAVLKVLKEWRVAPNAPLYPEAHYMSELRFLFVLKNGKAEVDDADDSEQHKVSSEFTKEMTRRKKVSAP